MVRIFLVIHLLLALAMVGVVLLQRSEGGALGIGGGGSRFMTGRQAGNLLTRTTAFLAAAFMVTSLTLAVLGGSGARVPRRSILEHVGGGTGNGTIIPGPMLLPAPTASPDVMVVPAPLPARTVEGSTTIPPALQAIGERKMNGKVEER